MPNNGSTSVTHYCQFKSTCTLFLCKSSILSDHDGKYIQIMSFYLLLYTGKIFLYGLRTTVAQQVLNFKLYLWLLYFI